MEYPVKTINVQHFFHSDNYIETYFWICVDSAKKKLEEEGLRAEVTFGDSKVSKLAIVNGYKH